MFVFVCVHAGIHACAVVPILLHRMQEQIEASLDKLCFSIVQVEAKGCLPDSIMFETWFATISGHATVMPRRIGKEIGHRGGVGFGFQLPELFIIIKGVSD